MKALGRLGTFVLTTGMSSLASLVAIPVIIARAGDYQWGVQAAVQSAAMLFGVLVAFGWGTTGAAEVASMPAEERPQWYAGSLVSRLYLFCCVYPAQVLVMGLLNRDFIPLVLVGSAAYLMPFLGASWYFVGEARPSRLFRFDALPQTAGMFASIVTMILTGSLVATVATQLVFNLTGCIISAAVVLRSASVPVRFDWSPRAAVHRLVAQRHSVVTSAASSLYVSTPLLVLNVVSPASMPLYAMGDKLFRFALTVFAPVLQFVQGWIPEGGRANLPHRIKQAARLTPLISVVGAVCVTLLGPLGAKILSSSAIDFSHWLALPFAVVFAAVSVTQVLGLACLVQLGRTRALAVSTVTGSVAGVPLIIIGALWAGVHGVAWALAASEIIVLVYQGRVIVAELRRRNASAVPGPEKTASMTAVSGDHL